MKDLTGKSVSANQRKGIKTYTGKLCFFENGIVFKAQSANGTLNMPMIEYESILSIKGTNTLGFLPNGIAIQTKNGEEFVFVVPCRNTVLAYLREKVNIMK